METHCWQQAFLKHQGEVFVLAALNPRSSLRTGKGGETHVCRQSGYYLKKKKINFIFKETFDQTISCLYSSLLQCRPTPYLLNPSAILTAQTSPSPPKSALYI